MSEDPRTIDPSLYFQKPAGVAPTRHRTANSHIKLIYDHDDVHSRRVLHLIRDFGIEPDIIHYRYSPLSRRELTGILKSLPEKELEFFIKLKSPRYQQRPFTISQKYTDQTINFLLPHQTELLNTPIVYNALTNNCVVAIPPDKVTAIIQRDLVGDNQQWDGGGDLFEVPANLQKSRSIQNTHFSRLDTQHQDEEQRYQAEQQQTERMRKDPIYREKVLQNKLEKTASQFIESYDSLVNQHEGDQNENHDGNFVRTSSQYFGASGGDVIDPRTGKPTLASLGLGEGGNSPNEMRLKYGLKYPGEHPRLENQEFQNRKQWREKQERTFGKLDESEFNQWRRERQEKKRLGILQ